MNKLVSIIVPAYNEEENIKPLISAVDSMIKESGLECELIIVDDGSTDRTYDVATELAEGREDIKIIRDNRNQGKTHAILSGLDVASGEYIAILDADLQYSPSEIPVMVERLTGGYDIVTGWKEGRYKKQFTSSIYNWLSRILFKIPVHDQNSIKVMRKEVLENMNLRKDWHRYIVALAVERGYKVTEVRVKLYPRKYGIEKYQGRGRVVIGLLDLIAVKFQVSFMRKPMLLFGTAGGVFLSLGVLTGLIALYMRFVLERGFRPLLNLVILFVVVGILLFMMGFTAEILSAMAERIERLEKRK
ncbi:glycosyltransferase family 2 protein [candidate division WOR-3 bacterium]|nr:glycosyltransferase family 2 protein [candidate division WOR-3 bacterium]